MVGGAAETELPACSRALLWKALEPLLPVTVPSTKGGRPRVDDRAAL